MRFQRGHPILEEFIRELASSFDGQDWGANGPKLVTRVLQRFCKTKELGRMSPDKCQGITVLQPEAFYPIPWRQWRDYFEEEVSEIVLKKLNESFIAHVWGKHSSGVPFNGLVPHAYSILARKHCPITFETVK
jgi:lactosylceramide 4-alpha-galactosyltransferase